MDEDEVAKHRPIAPTALRAPSQDVEERLARLEERLEEAVEARIVSTDRSGRRPRSCVSSAPPLRELNGSFAILPARTRRRRSPL